MYVDQKMLTFPNLVGSKCRMMFSYHQCSGSVTALSWQCFLNCIIHDGTVHVTSNLWEFEELCGIPLQTPMNGGSSALCLWNVCAWSADDTCSVHGMSEYYLQPTHASNVVAERKSPNANKVTCDMYRICSNGWSCKWLLQAKASKALVSNSSGEWLAYIASWYSLIVLKYKHRANGYHILEYWSN